MNSKTNEYLIDYSFKIKVKNEEKIISDKIYMILSEKKDKIVNFALELGTNLTEIVVNHGNDLFLKYVPSPEPYPFEIYKDYRDNSIQLHINKFINRIEIKDENLDKYRLERNDNKYIKIPLLTNLKSFDELFKKLSTIETTDELMYILEGFLMSRFRNYVLDSLIINKIEN